MLTRTGRRRGFNLLEVTIAVVLVAGLSGAAALTARQARLEFDHSKHRNTLTGLVSAVSLDASARASVFNPDLLQLYAEGGRFAVEGVASIDVGPTSASDQPGEVAAIVSEDRRMISAAMMSTRSRCLRVHTVNGVPSAVSSQRADTCRPLAPSSILAAAGSSTPPPAPSQVTGLTVEQVASGRVAFSWNLSASAAAHLLTVEPSGASCLQNAPSASCVLDLPAGSHTAVVEAQNASGFSVPSAPVEFEVATAPSTPSVQVTAIPGGLSLSWAAPAANGSPVLSYTVEHLPSGGTWTAQQVAAPATGAQVYDVGAGDVFVRVSASNLWGSSAPSALVQASAGALPPPTLSGLTAVPGGLSAEFTLPAGVVTDGPYLLEYTTDAGSSWRDAGTLTSPAYITSRSSDGASLEPGGTYEVRLRLTVVGVSSDASQPASASLLDRPSAPAVASVTPGDGQVTVVFSPPTFEGSSPVTSYQFSLDGGVSWQSRSPASVASPLVISGLTNGTSYLVSIRPSTADGPGGYSAPVQVTPRTVPSAPQSVQASGVDGAVSVTFQPPADDGGSIVLSYEFSTDGGLSWRARGAGTTGSPLLILTRSSDGAALVPGTSYQVRIRAVNAAGAGTASGSVSAVPYTAPDAPVLSASGLNLSWTAPDANGSAVSGYRLERSVSGGDWEVLLDGGVLTSYLAEQPSAGVEVSFRVAAANAAGYGPWSSYLTITG